jgi:hypothetical protein
VPTAARRVLDQDAGVVDQDVEAAVALSTCRRRRRCWRVGDVELDGLDRQALGLQLQRCSTACSRLRPASSVCTPACQLAHGLMADATGGAGDQRDVLMGIHDHL